MAEKKMTQAQKMSAAQKSGSRSSKKRSGREKQPEKGSGTQNKPQSVPNADLRWMAACIYLVLFFVFTVIALNQKGFILTAIRAGCFGLFGPVTFYLAIPATLFLFFLHAFDWDSATVARSVYTWISVFLAGCISHITMRPQLEDGFALITSLYRTGGSSESGGVLCGLAGGFLADALSAPLALILLTIAAVLFLMAALRLTIPALIRAFQDRPRFEDEEEALPPKPEPAEALVNHMAVKQHEMKQKRQQKQLQLAQEREEQKRLQEQKAREDAQRGKEILRQISDPIAQPKESENGVIAEFDEPGELPQRPSSVSQPVIPEIPPIPPIPEIPKAPRMEPIPVEGLEQPAAPVQSPVIPADEEVLRSVEAEPGVMDAEPVEQPPQKVTAKEAAASAAEISAEIATGLQAAPGEKPVYEFPSVELLRQPRGGSADGTAEMRENTRRLNEALASFKVDAHVTNVTRGPSVTRYEVELMQGVRLNKLTSVADDIALSLGTSGVRIAPVPNKISVVGIEVPNQAVTMVTLREVVDSEAFRRAKSSASFAVGKDISGSCIVGNITKLPHMLIAGTTGSGKSVCMNSIILSLLYKASPEDVRLIMVDPKMVELGIYNGIPHLLIPVVTDPKKAAGSLQWAVTEMMRRYRFMSEAGVRDLEAYNDLIDGGSLEGEHMAQVVVIIDELADLMLVAAKEVEESICRIAQMGRASGIHLIIATQRPSADVITGLMKANIPSRIAFAVASAMESRIILDNSGAEKLVGKGDMLYAPIGIGKPVRVQGCFVSDAEVEAVATYVKTHYTNTYDDKVLQEIEQNAAKTGNSKSSGPEPEANADEQAYDELLIPAVDAVLQVQQASVSMLQRKLKLGFSRAARIVDTMEELGIVGEHCGSKPRQILVTPDQWAQMKISLTGGELPRMTAEYPPESDPIPEEID